MMSGFEVKCINKNPNGMIVRIGGENWSLSLYEAVNALLIKRLAFNIFLGNEYLQIGVRGESPNSYLVIEPDGYALHDVLGLPSC